MLEQKVETFTPEPVKKKKVNLVPILIGVIAVLIVLASVFTVYRVLSTQPEEEKSQTTNQPQASPSASINNDQDLQEAEEAIDGINTDSLEADLDQNDKDASNF